MEDKGAITMQLLVHKRVWIVLREGFCLEVEEALELGQVLKDKEKAMKAISNGHKVVELSWSRFQSLLQQMVD